MGSPAEEGLSDEGGKAFLGRKVGSDGDLRYLRIGKIFWMASVVLLLVLSGFVGTVVYSSNEISYEGVTPVSEASPSASELIINATVGISNPGVYSVTGLHIGIHLLSSSGSLISEFHSSTLDVAGGSSSDQVPVGLPLNTSSPDVSSLFTNDSKLGILAWVNGTYVSVIPFKLMIRDSYSWGAPFDALHYTVGPSQSEVNGTYAYPVNISFSNYSPIPEFGDMRIVLYSASDTFCGKTNLSLPILTAGDMFSGGAVVYTADNCDLTGGIVYFTYISLSSILTLHLPPEPIR